jgi:hypothetical protein
LPQRNDIAHLPPQLGLLHNLQTLKIGQNPRLKVIADASLLIRIVIICPMPNTRYAHAVARNAGFVPVNVLQVMPYELGALSSLHTLSIGSKPSIIVPTMEILIQGCRFA